MLTEKQIELLLSEIEITLHDLGHVKKRMDTEFIGVTLKAYVVGKNIRIDIIPDEQ